MDCLQSPVRIFWGREQDAHLLEINQYADKLLEQTLQAPEPVSVALYKIQGDHGRRSNFVATVADQDLRLQEPIRKSLNVRQDELGNWSSNFARIIRSNESHYCRVCLATDHNME